MTYELKDGQWVPVGRVDIYNIDKPWGELSPEEKGALLLHHHEGGEIEMYVKRDGWVSEAWPSWLPKYVYRAYKKPEPMVETKEFTSWGTCNNWTRDGDLSLVHHSHGKYKITFKTIDGEPDCGSIEMEKLL